MLHHVEANGVEANLNWPTELPDNITIGDMQDEVANTIQGLIESYATCDDRKVIDDVPVICSIVTLIRLRELLKVVRGINGLVDQAWAIIANAGGGDWEKESADWRDGAKDWRDQYHKNLSRRLAITQEGNKQDG